MSRRYQLQKLLQTPGLWKAAEAAKRRRPILATGFAELDQALSGGWPLGAVIELLADACGIGEFRLLLPALRALDGKRRILLVAPPYIPYAPALMHHGLDLSRLLIARCQRSSDVLWTVEQALHSEACVAVAAWVGATDERSLRRLQLAGEGRDVLIVLFRSARFVAQRSPAALRILLKPGDQAEIQLDILKYRGGRPQICCIAIGAD